MNKKEHSGQVALVLVLIMTVVSALAVSLASRSTIDTKIQETESESVQALLLAQTGLEQLMLNPLETVAGSLGDNYYAETSNQGQNEITTGTMAPGSMIEINLLGADYNTLTGFRVYWKPDLDSVGKQPTIVVSITDTDGEIIDYGYNYLGDNGFTIAQDGSAEGYEKSTPVLPPTAMTSSIANVRIFVLGVPSLLKIVPVGTNAMFPDQTKSIKATGTVPSDDKSVKYGLQYDESIADSVPAVFDYALFSGGSIIQ